LVLRHLKNKKYTDAMNATMLVSEKNPNYFTMFFSGYIKFFYMDNGEEEGIELMKKVITLTPNIPEYHKILGEAYLKVGDTHDAIDSFKNFINISKSPSIDSYILLGNNQMSIESYEDAFNNFKLVIGKDKKNAYAYRGIAFCYNKLKNKKMAIDYYEKAMLYAPYGYDIPALELGDIISEMRNITLYLICLRIAHVTNKKKC